MSKVAIVQQAPVLLDRIATTEKAVDAVAEAAGKGAELVVFPEAFIPGYPAWIWRLRPGGDMALAEKLHAKLFENSVNLARGDLAPLQKAAQKHKVTVVCGIDEWEETASRTTLYNTVVIIGPNGDILNRHRKVMPTNAERMVWGFGDATGLKVVDTPAGRLGTLICWENYMPQARLAMYAQGIEIYIAPTFDDGDAWVASMQHIAREGRCWVIGSGFALHAKDIPADFPERETVFPSSGEWINPGDSVIVAPGGSIVTGPMRDEYGLLCADVDISQVITSRRALDVAGHYARPDLFQLQVNTQPMAPVVFNAESGH
ncbi:carbon-nitrogen hydrolase family protein [Planctomycetota bacterium]